MYERKLIPAEFFVLSKDRVMLDKKLPQLYGTQVNADGSLYKCDNLDSVVVRRKNLGLVPLDDYILSINNLK